MLGVHECEWRWKWGGWSCWAWMYGGMLVRLQIVCLDEDGMNVVSLLLCAWLDSVFSTV